MIDTVRAAVLAAHPAIVENEKWNSPNFAFDGVDRVTIRVNPKGGIQVIFHRGAKVRADAATFRFDDPTGLLEWKTPDRGVLTIRDDADALAKAADLTRLVKLWVEV
jgi:hypothetical protein